MHSSPSSRYRAVMRLIHFIAQRISANKINPGGGYRLEIRRFCGTAFCDKLGGISHHGSGSFVVSAAKRRVPHPPGFPVRLGGVNELHAAFLKRKPHTQRWLAQCSRKSGVLEPVFWVQGWDTRRCASKFVVSHPCRKTPARMGHPQIGLPNDAPETLADPGVVGEKGNFSIQMFAKLSFADNIYRAGLL
jgi:hypothetical protein